MLLPLLPLLLPALLLAVSCSRPPRQDAANQETSRALAELAAAWENPPVSVRPHVGWVWPGNSASDEIITRQLTDLQQRGFGGVEIRSARQIFQRGNVEYLSPQFFERVRSAVTTARQLGLHVALRFGPSTPLCGAPVQNEDRAQELVMTSADLRGPTKFDAFLPYLPMVEPASMQPVGVFLARAAGDGDGIDPASVRSVADQIAGVAWAGRAFALNGTRYIWADDNERSPDSVAFRRRFHLPSGRRVASAFLTTNADDQIALQVNGRVAGMTKAHRDLLRLDVSAMLHQGDNVICALCGNSGGRAGLALTLQIDYDDGGKETVATDESWTWNRTPPDDWMNTSFDDSAWQRARSYGACGETGTGWQGFDPTTVTLPQVRLRLEIPQGDHRLLTFWLAFTGERCAGEDPFLRAKPAWVVDHLDREAVGRLSRAHGETFSSALGPDLGQTIRGFSTLSFAKTTSGIHWSKGLPAALREARGYDILPRLPALWFDCGETTPKLRHDVNETIHRLAVDAALGMFNRRCAGHNMKAIYGYRTSCPVDPIQAAGAVHLPETDHQPRSFEVNFEYRKPIVSGAKLYGREFAGGTIGENLGNRYRVTPADMKRALDSMLREGIASIRYQQLLATPETILEPYRELPQGTPLGISNPWWEHARALADYTARCCLLLRRGTSANGLLLYLPQADVWSARALFTSTDQRKTLTGALGRTLVASGHDFDMVNDDLLQSQARFDGGQIDIRGNRYRLILLPRVQIIPLETLEAIDRFVRGGGVAIALESLPGAAAGLPDKPDRDGRVRQIVGELFSKSGGDRPVDAGTTYFLPDYRVAQARYAAIGPDPDLSNSGDALNIRLIRTIAHHVPTDFSPGQARITEGLSYHHRRDGDLDIYFVANLQTRPSDEPIHFGVTGKVPQFWNPLDGTIRPALLYREFAKTTRVDLHLLPWETTFVVFAPGARAPHALSSTLQDALSVTDKEFVGLARANGVYAVEIPGGSDGEARMKRVEVRDLPANHRIASRWRILLKGAPYASDTRVETETLFAWGDRPETAKFSGTAVYSTDFELPAALASDDLQLELRLGTVGDIASATLNGKPLGTDWTPPCRFSISDIVQPGVNRLEINVTNNSGPRVELADGPAPLDPSLTQQYGEFKRDFFQDGFRHLDGERKKLEPRPLNGLIGPVEIVAARKVRVALD